MPPSATIYAEELHHYGHGHPLWSPEPTRNLDGRERDVQLGDVGHIDEDGCFWRLFNITVDSDHEWNGGRVPVGFVPLKIPQHLKTFKEDYLNPGALSSKSMRARAGGASLSANVPGIAGVELSYDFSCSSDRGALLLLDDYASKAAFQKTRLLTDYMLANHANWYSFATNVLHIHCKPSDIVLVRATVKTSVWTVVACIPSTTHMHKAAFEGNLGAIPSVGMRFSFERSMSHSYQCRSGPLHRSLPPAPHAIASSSRAHDMPVTQPNSKAVAPSPFLYSEDHQTIRDQSIFLGLYKLKHRKVLPAQIVANAERPFADDGSGGGGSGAVPPVESEWETETEHILPQSPLDDVLDYILEYSEAEVAIACDADIQSLPLSDSFSTYADALRMWLPKITLDTSFKGIVGQLDTVDVNDSSGMTNSPRVMMLQHAHQETHEETSPQAGSSSQVDEDPDREFELWHLARLNTAYPPDSTNGTAVVFYHRIWRALLDGDTHHEHTRRQLPSELVEMISRLAGLCIPDDDRVFTRTRTCSIRSAHSFQSKLWFCTSPFTREDIRNIAAIQLTTTSSQQGRDDDRTSWSWFEWGFFPSAQEAKRREEASWETSGWHISHRNRVDTPNPQTLEGRIVTPDDSMWQNFTEGSILAVRICARFLNTENHARRGEIRYWKWFKPVLWSNA